MSDPLYDDGATQDVGAVYLYSSNGTLISTLKGSTSGDKVGLYIRVLTNGNAVVVSPFWDRGPLADAGAVTWINASSGLNGVVSQQNSIVGSSAYDRVGSLNAGNLLGIVLLSNSNYVVVSPDWDDGIASDVGAVTWASGTSSTGSVVGPSNSLVGTTADDRIGQRFLNNGGSYIASGLGVRGLLNGNYVVTSPAWDNGSTVDAGAATWCDGTTGRVGAVSQANSLVGTTAIDQVGSNGIFTLSNGNYTVQSDRWANGNQAYAGASTFVNGSSGSPTGPVSNTNSFVGKAFYQIGSGQIVELSTGNYVAYWSFADLGVSGDQNYVQDVGAVTYGSGTTGVQGEISTSNTFFTGTSTNDSMGGQLIALYGNGNFVLSQPYYDSASTQDIGAVTWFSGASAPTGIRNNTTNSITGSTTYDQVGKGLLALENGNYIIFSSEWDNGSTANVGAVTWASGSTSSNFSVAAANSLIGSTAGDLVGSVLPPGYRYSNSKFVVGSPLWDNGATYNVGAVTVLDGSSSFSGTISSSNSLIGSSAGDLVGSGGFRSFSSTPAGSAFPNAINSFVVLSPAWANGSATSAGAATWMSLSAPVTGVVSSSNSLVGSTTGDGSGLAMVLANTWGIVLPSWDNGATTNAGAVTLMSATQGVIGTINSSNSVIGGISNSSPPISV